MKDRVLLLLGLISFIVNLYASGQTVTLTKEEKLRKNKVWSLYTYIQKTPFEEVNQEKLFREYVTYFSFAEDTAQSIDPRRKEIFKRQLKSLDTMLETFNLSDFDAVPWSKFAYVEKLPRLLWQDEPLTHLFGQPLENNTTDRKKVVEEGKNQLANTLVIFKKDTPAIPRYYILFDEKTNRIVSWTLINQGGLHYFLPF